MEGSMKKIIFTLAVCLLQISEGRAFEEQRNVEYLSTNAQAIKLDPIQAKKNFSGLTYVPHTRSYFAIINKGNLLFEFEENFALRRTITLNGFSDPEDLAFIGMTQNGPALAIAEETGGVLLGVVGTSATLQASSMKRVRLLDDSGRELVFRDNKGLEGIAYLPGEEKLILVKEKKPIKVWSIPLAEAINSSFVKVTNHLSAQAEKEINYLVTDLSAVSYNYKEKALAYLSDESSRLIYINNATKSVSKVIEIQTRLQHEALAFSRDYETTFVGSEPYYLLQINNSNTAPIISH